MSVPEDRKYTESHEWAKPEGDVVRVGITDFAQSQLADLTFVELPEVGRVVEAGEEIAVVESVKAASDLYAPVSGSIVETNESLESAPEAINDDAFEAGWMFVIEPNESSAIYGLLDAAAYSALIPQDD